MCGFVGLLSFFDEKNFLRKMNNTLNHRGPDDEGYWYDVEDGIFFGHKRLSILDLSKAGSQPMLSASQRWIIVFNGEIYNHTAIRKDINDQYYQKNNKNIKWRSNCDTETLVESIDILGLKKTLEKIRGMFAFALWDKKNKELILSRDRMGEKPLYYGWLGERFFFASELKAIKEHPNFVNKIDKKALNYYLKYNFVPSPLSIYESIYKLEPSTFLITSKRNKKINLEKYWHHNNEVENHKIDKQNNLSQYADQLESIIKESVNLQSKADVPIGTFLSGGIDSTLITALLSNVSTKSVNTFTIGFYEKFFDESNYAKQISKYLHTDHNEVFFTSSDALNIIPKLSKIYCEPFSDKSQLPTFLLSNFASNNVKTVLSGDGADELFGGYNRYIFAKKILHLQKKLPKPLFHIFKKIVKHIPSYAYNNIYNLFYSFKNKQNINYNIQDQMQKFFKALESKNYNEYYQNILSNNNDNLLINFENDNYAFQKINYSNNISIEQYLMFIDQNFYLPDDILCKIDRAAMSNSLETRTPYLDKEVVEFSKFIPENFKINNNQGKIILKEILKKYIPTKYISRPKMGFDVPVKEWLKNDLRNWTYDLLNPIKIKEQGFFDSSKINKKLENHMNGKKDNHNTLWNILIFQQWLQDN